METDARIAELVKNFVAQVTDLARQAAVATLAAALDGVGGAAAKAPARSATRKVPSKGAQASPAQASPAQARRKGAKRPAAEVERLMAVLTKHVERNPGQRVEQINKALGTQTKDVARPLAKLIKAGALKTKGERRATTYHPA